MYTVPKHLTRGNLATHHHPVFSLLYHTAPFPDHIFTLQGCSQFVTHAEEKGIAYVGGNLVGGSRKSVVLYKYDT